MFCHKCGKADQAPNSYCRGCGEFIADPKRGNMMAFGGTTPQQNVNAINILSVIAVIASLLAAFWMYITQMKEPIALYFGAALLLCNAAWHLSNFYVGMKLKRKFGKASKTWDDTDKQVKSAKTRELLPEMKEQDIIPVSVTENTTRHLNEKIKR